MYFVLDMALSCYLCGSTKLTKTRTKLRYDVTRDVFRCNRCSVVFLRPKNVDLQKYYAGEYRKQYSPVLGKSNTSKEIYDIYAPVQASRLARVKKYLGKNKRVLDVGASAGQFLKVIKPHVKEAVALEYNLDNAAFMRKTLGIRAYTEPLEKTDLPEKYFDVIFCFQTLEHMDDPLLFLKTAKRYLKPGGIISIEIPNLNEASISVYHNKAYEDFYYREPHLFYYTPKTLKLLMQKAGYRGKVESFQWYNFVNQMHWLLVNGPQTSGYDGLKTPELVTAKDVSSATKSDLNHFIARVDAEYKKLLEKHMVSDQITFVGKPV